MRKRKITLLDWLDKADNFYQDSKRAIYPPFTSASAGYLLHLAIELYLKSFLIDRGKIVNQKQLRVAGHDLEKLFATCAKIEPLFRYAYQDEEKNQQDWIRFLNGFGYPDGGVRYALSRATNLPIEVHEYFENLVMLIANSVNDRKVITEIV